ERKRQRAGGRFDQVNPVDRIERARLPLGEHRRAAVLIGIPERQASRFYLFGDEFVRGKEPEDGVLIAEGSQPQRLPPEEDRREQDQKQDYEQIANSRFGRQFSKRFCRHSKRPVCQSWFLIYIGSRIGVLMNQKFNTMGQRNKGSKDCEGISGSSLSL